MNIEKHNNGAAKNVYSALRDQEIRLVRIHHAAVIDPIECSLFVVPDLRAVAFKALSYVWGSQEDAEAILLNRTPWMVTANLALALAALRSEVDDCIVWIDALAINQSDLSERSVQVLRMQSVYSSADSVLVYLGQSSDDIVAVLLNIVRLWDADYRSDKKEQWSLWDKAEEMGISLHQAMQQICRNEYWNRAWVIREIYLADYATVIYGHHHIDYFLLKAFWKEAYHTLIRSQNWGLLSPDVDLDEVRYGGPNAIPLSESAFQRDQHITIKDWTRLVVDKTASDARDLVYAFYSLFDEVIRDQLQVDCHKSLPEVLVFITRLIIDLEVGLDILTMGPRPRQIVRHRKDDDPDSIQYTVPSWVPQYFRKDRYHKVTGPSGSLAFEAEPRTSSWSDGILEISGICIGTLSAVGLPMAAITGDSLPLHSSGELLARVDDHLRSLRNQFFEEKLVDEQLNDFVNAFLAGLNFTVLPSEGRETLKLLEAHSQKPLLSSMQALDAVERHEQSRLFSYEPLPPQASSYDYSRNCSRGEYQAVLKRHFGISPMEVAIGDVVCGIAGCSQPIVLRKNEEYYELIGTANIPTCMTGIVINEKCFIDTDLQPFYII